MADLEQHEGSQPEKIGVVISVDPGPGMLYQLTGVIARLDGDITSVAIMESPAQSTRIYFEIDLPGEASELERELRTLDVVQNVEFVNSLKKIFGKRIIIMGGGAQVGQVAIGAISEADRHNIRGEHISIDTIPLVGEQALADAVRAVARLPRTLATTYTYTGFGDLKTQVSPDTGTTTNTYTMAGVNSDASRAAQGAPAYIVTSNASGDLAGRTPAELGLASQSDLNRAFKKIDENTQGIAIAMAMGGLSLPAGKTFAVAANFGFYDDKQALAVQSALKLGETLTLNGGFGAGLNGVNGFSDATKFGGRVGLTAAW